MNAEKLLYNMALASILKQAGPHTMDPSVTDALASDIKGSFPAYGLPPGAAQAMTPQYPAASEAPPPGYMPPAGQPSPAELSQDYMGPSPTEAPPSPTPPAAPHSAMHDMMQNYNAINRGTQLLGPATNLSMPGWGAPPGLGAALGGGSGGR